MRFQSYFNTAIKIIKSYNGTIPLSFFLKQYFSENKKHGSKDRKFITHACYNYYRIGHSLKNVSIEERLKSAIFLCNETAGEWCILYDDKWLEHWSVLLNERIAFITHENADFHLGEIFFFTHFLSNEIDIAPFITSHLVQPDVFLRIRNNYYDTVVNKLEQHKISFTEIDKICIAVLNTTKVDDIIKIDEEAVIQDYSSQRISEFLKILKSKTQNPKSEIVTWDCCAGSGGKSILAYDVLLNISLTVSDVRSSIIHNLNQRFLKAHISSYKTFVFDIINSKLQIPNSPFDLIICDAPCTGSGTWGRTPEQLFFFQQKKIETYSSLQKEIASSTIKHLKTGGYFLYITCSVFKAENESIVEYLKDNLKLELIKTEMLKGYNKKADTMFAALLKK